jgi:hypothetical protein
VTRVDLKIEPDGVMLFKQGDFLLRVTFSKAPSPEAMAQVEAIVLRQLARRSLRANITLPLESAPTTPLADALRLFEEGLSRLCDR